MEGKCVLYVPSHISCNQCLVCHLLDKKRDFSISEGERRAYIIDAILLPDIRTNPWLHGPRHGEYLKGGAQPLVFPQDRPVDWRCLTEIRSSVDSLPFPLPPSIPANPRTEPWRSYLLAPSCVSCSLTQHDVRTHCHVFLLPSQVSCLACHNGTDNARWSS